MKAWFLLGPRHIELRDAPDPEMGPEEALVRPRAVGICGSDAECFLGTHPLPNYPRLPGHEFSGEVAAVGDRWTGPAVGTRVSVDPALSCGQCYACRNGRHNCCVDVSIAGVHRPGALAEFVVCRQSQLFPLPDEISFETAAMIETLSIGAQVCRRGAVEAGDRVIILGGGPIGLCCLMMARHRGAEVLVSEPLVWRRELAGELGATACVDPERESVRDVVTRFTEGYGGHVVVDATGEIHGAELAVELAGSAGRVVILTLSDSPMRVRPWQLVRRELAVSGSRLTLADFGELVALVGDGTAPVGRLVSHRFGFEEADAAFRAACERPEGAVKAVVRW